LYIALKIARIGLVDPRTVLLACAMGRARSVHYLRRQGHSGREGAEAARPEQCHQTLMEG
jgi:hypothetical protein